MAIATAPAIKRTPHRFTVAEYYRMAETGILHPEDRVELLDGEIVDMSPMRPPHAAAGERVRHVLSAAIAGRAQVRDQKPLTLGQYDEPEPDLAVVRPRADYYATAHPGAADVLLLIEVADSSLMYDRSGKSAFRVPGRADRGFAATPAGRCEIRTKAAIYAAAGIQELWLVNLPEGVLEVYRDAGPSGYHYRQALQRGERVAPLAFPELDLAIADLLPPGTLAQEQETCEIRS